MRSRWDLNPIAACATEVSWPEDAIGPLILRRLDQLRSRLVLENCCHLVAASASKDRLGAVESSSYMGRERQAMSKAKSDLPDTMLLRFSSDLIPARLASVAEELDRSRHWTALEALKLGLDLMSAWAPAGPAAVEPTATMRIDVRFEALRNERQSRE